MTLFVGIEAEGRLRGVPTLYVSDVEPIEPDDVRSVNARHVWFNPEHIAACGYDSARTFLSAGWIVTLNLTPDQFEYAPKGVLSGCHIVLAIPVPGVPIHRLGPDDEIRLDIGHLHSFTIRAGTLVEARREDYDADLPVDRDVPSRITTPIT